MGRMKDLFIEQMNEYDRDWSQDVWDDSAYDLWRNTPPRINANHKDYSAMKSAMVNNYVEHNGWLFGYYPSIECERAEHGEGYFLKQVSID